MTLKPYSDLSQFENIQQVSSDVVGELKDYGIQPALWSEKG